VHKTVLVNGVKRSLEPENEEELMHGIANFQLSQEQAYNYVSHAHNNAIRCIAGQDMLNWIYILLCYTKQMVSGIWCTRYLLLLCTTGVVQQNGEYNIRMLLVKNNNICDKY